LRFCNHYRETVGVCHWATPGGFFMDLPPAAFSIPHRCLPLMPDHSTITCCLKFSCGRLDGISALATATFGRGTCIGGSFHPQRGQRQKGRYACMFGARRLRAGGSGVPVWRGWLPLRARCHLYLPPPLILCHATTSCLVPDSLHASMPRQHYGRWRDDTILPSPRWCVVVCCTMRRACVPATFLRRLFAALHGARGYGLPWFLLSNYTRPDVDGRGWDWCLRVGRRAAVSALAQSSALFRDRRWQPGASPPKRSLRLPATPCLLCYRHSLFSSAANCSRCHGSSPPSAFPPTCRLAARALPKSNAPQPALTACGQVLSDRFLCTDVWEKASRGEHISCAFGCGAGRMAWSFLFVYAYCSSTVPPSSGLCLSISALLSTGCDYTLYPTSATTWYLWFSCLLVTLPLCCDVERTRQRYAFFIHPRFSLPRCSPCTADVAAPHASPHLYLPCATCAAPFQAPAGFFLPL
jgi:hypothetical protein